ncbi:MAG: fibronectin type III domain-containing protein [Thermoplasmata archaeon]|nr:fibronectin type III domain-containing protein [Thermoplasmata archaeon]
MAGALCLLFLGSLLVDPSASGGFAPLPRADASVPAAPSLPALPALAPAYVQYRYVSLPAVSGGGYGVAFDALHRTYDVVGTTGLTAVAEGSWSVVGSLSLSLGSYTRVAVDPGRERAFVSGGTVTNVVEVNTSTLSVMSTLRTSADVEGLAVDPTLALLVYCNGTDVSFYDYVTGAPPVDIPTVGCSRVAIDTDHRLVAGTEPGTSVVAILNETTHRWFSNATVYSAPLPVVYDPASHEFISGSNGASEISIFLATHPGVVTNLSVPGISLVQDESMVGVGADELLVWGNSQMDVFDVPSQTFLQQVTPSSAPGFPYGIATDPVTHVAVGIDPVNQIDLPFAPITPLKTVLFSAGTAFSGGGYGVAFDAFHDTFDVVGSAGVQVVQEGTWSGAGSIPISLGNYDRIAIDSGRQLGFFSGGTAGNVRVFNTTTLSVVLTLKTGSNAAQGLAVDPIRHLLVYANGSGISFFNYATLAAPITIPASAGGRVAIDPDHQIVAVSEGSMVALLNETTRKWITNVTITQVLPVGYDNLTGEAVLGSNGGNALSHFQMVRSNPVTNVTIGSLTTTQDLCMVGGGSDEALLWGTSSLVVYAVNNDTILQTLSGSGNFPYGIAEDPATFTALGVDPVNGYDSPYYGTVQSPTPPTGVTASPGNGTFTVRWSASSSTGLTNYSVSYGASPSSLTSSYSVGSASTLSATLPWVNGAKVYADVVAWVGTQPSAPSSPVVSTTPGSIPYPPEAVSVTPSNRSLLVSWGAPASNGGWSLLNFSVGVGATPTSLRWSWSAGGPASSLWVYGFTDGVPEFVAVRAWNVIGGSNPSGVTSATPAGAPFPVQGLGVTSGNGTLTASWNAPVSDDGSPIDNYSLGLGASPTSLLWSYSTGTGSQLSYTFAPLLDGAIQYVSVRAWNAIGGSNASLPVAGTPVGVPYPVRALVLLPSNHTLTVHWQAPLSDEGAPVVNYSVGWGSSPQSLIWSGSTGSGSNFWFNVTGLPDGARVYVAVRAWNAVGGSTLSSPVSGTPAGVPYPVRSVYVAGANNSLLINWTAPYSDDGSPVVNFSIGMGTSGGGLIWNNATGSGSVVSFRIGGLTNGVVLFVSVRAWNALGGSAPSTPTGGTPGGAPFPVVGLSVTSYNTTLSVGWSAPVSDGGVPIDHFWVTSATSPGGPNTTTEVSGSCPCSMALQGLVDGQAYYVSVRAHNPRGNSTATTPRVGIPAGVPYPPEAISVDLVGPTDAVASWSAPFSIDGNALTGYVLEYQVGQGPVQNVSLGPAILTYRLSGLPSGTSLALRVLAENAVGAGNATGWVTIQTPQPSVGGIQLLGTSWGWLLALVGAFVLAIVLIILYRRRRKDSSSRSPPTGSGRASSPDAVAPTPPKLWAGAPGGSSSDEVAPSYGTYPLASMPEWSEESPPDEERGHGPTTSAFSPLSPYVMTVRPEGIRVEQILPGGQLAPVRSGEASGASPAPVASEEEYDEEGEVEVAETGVTPVAHPAPTAHVPQLTGADAYSVLGSLSSQARSLDGIKQATRLEDDGLLLLLGAFVRAKLVTRSAATTSGAPGGTFALTPAGRSVLRRGLPSPSQPSPPSAATPAPNAGTPSPTYVPSGSLPPPLGLTQLPASHAVVLHLSAFHGHRDEAVVPSEVSQAGIAQALATTPNSVAVTLKRLEDGGLVQHDLRHVKGARRRLKTYFLTEKGLSFRRELLKSREKENRQGPQ